MIGYDPWYCHICKLRHANACPTAWGGDFVPAPRNITFADLKQIYIENQKNTDIEKNWKKLVAERRNQINMNHFSR